MRDVIYDATDDYGFGTKTDGIKDMVYSLLFQYHDTAIMLIGFTF